MSNVLEMRTCKAFAQNLGRLLAQALGGASGSNWKIDLVDSQAPPVASPEASVQFRLNFGEALTGACYLVLSEADAATLAGEVEEPAAALLALLEGVCLTVGKELSAVDGGITLHAESTDVRDPLASEILELHAQEVAGAAARILLYFDPKLLASFASQTQGIEPEGAERGAADPAAQANLELVLDVELSVTLRFGQRQLSLREILDLASGSVVELDRQVDEPVELMLDGRVIARGEAVIIDGNYGLRVTQVLQPVPY